MGIVIKQVEVTVKGAVVKKFDGSISTMRFDMDQALALRHDLDAVISLLDPSTPAGGVS